MLISMGSFFRLVLPSEGYYCAVVFRKGGGAPDQIFTPSLDELEQRILVEDAHGHTVYHACASYLTPGRRTQDNVRFCKALWLDIDCGDGKPYRTTTEAVLQLVEFSRSVFIKPECLVESGSGLHVYWTLEQNAKPADWREVAEGLRGLCDEFGLCADHVRTCDSASILRPPGTHNRKHGDERRVICRQ